MKTLLPHFMRNARQSGGFTLVEVCISMAIMAVTVVPLLGLMATGLAQVGTTIDNNQAANIAQQVFVTARQGGFYSLTTTPTYTNYYNAEGDKVSSGTAGVVYDAVVTCTMSAVAAPTPPLVTMVVKVRKAPNGVDNANSANIATFVGTVSCQDISGYNAKTN